MDTKEIEHLIQQAIPDAEVLVQSDDGHHFTARVIAASFADLSRVKQHQKVNAALKSVLDSGALHALALQTSAPQ